MPGLHASVHALSFLDKHQFRLAALRTNASGGSCLSHSLKMTKPNTCHLSNHSGSRVIRDKSVLSFKEKLSPPQMLRNHKEATKNKRRCGTYTHTGTVGAEPASRGTVASAGELCPKAPAWERDTLPKPTHRTPSRPGLWL